ncbi:MAG: Lon protease [Patescibacteria group bacterium]|nr:MAG: Lon protease [Patescibacteria group bacterium]
MNSKSIKVLRQIPVVAIRDSVVFPHTDNILSFGRQKSVLAVNSAFQSQRVVAIFTQKNPEILDPQFKDLYEVGTIATIAQMMSSDEDVHALIRGQARVKIESLVKTEPFLVADIVEVSETREDKPEVDALAKRIVDLFKRAIKLGKQAEIVTVMKIVSGQSTPVELADQVASLLEINTEERMKFLEETSLLRRLQMVFEALLREVNVLEIERSISSKTQKKFEDQVRKAMLREKKRAIEEELGEEESEIDSDEVKMYKKKIKEAKMPKDVEEKAMKELKRLMQMPIQNPESGYIRNYLDWLCDMPWSKESPNNISIKKAASILKKEHYGLDKVKERILEYLAVMKIKKGKKSQEAQPTILCFIGPPGVGKTSIGRSIAKALGRSFVRVSLGGIRDEAEIRGHRRTYVGALPGRIIQGIKNAKTKNPVFMLDEIDKLGVDFRGDPSSALLEALDPEQNKEFSDHYLEVPFDLSKVMFIATGNVAENIIDPLRDRMEIIRFPGYTQDEKQKIAEEFLWPKQLKLHGLEDKKIKISKLALDEIIERYTKEAGVRELERMLATICRKLARSVAEGKKYPKTIKVSDVKKFLGPRKFSSALAEKKDEVGVVTGLAVTPAGGEILFVEVALMPGKGKLYLTGQLGDVMKESAKAAFSWARSHWQDFGLKANFGNKTDVHIHVPEGAVPKDGPSAGVALATALVSALTGISVKKEVGMTGEITLRGKVMEIGGVKEKVIAGYRAGLKVIILPKGNKKDMEDVPSEVKKNIKFVFVDNLEDVLKVALTKDAFNSKFSKTTSNTISPAFAA